MPLRPDRPCDWPRVVAGILAALLLSAAPAAAQQVRLAYLYSDGNLAGTTKAFRALLEEHPELRDRVALTLLSESIYDDVQPSDLTSADVLVYDVMNEQMLARYNGEHGVDLMASIGQVLCVGEGLMPREQYLEQGCVWDDRARAFWAHSGSANRVALMKLALSRAGVPGLNVPDPELSLDFGYYYPQGGEGRVFPTWQAFDDWRRTQGKIRPGAPRVAVGFYRASYYTGETELLNSVITEIERRGAEAIPVFGFPGDLTFEQLLLDETGTPRADVALAFLFRFAAPAAAGRLERLGIPIINLISLYGRTEAEWRASPVGLSLFEGTFQVAVPELGGLIAPTVVGSQERAIDPTTGLTVVVRKPIGSRIEMVVDRALAYSRLRETPNRDRRVALLYYNYPPGKANVGASYLNVSDSIANILERLRAEGYDVGDAPVSGEALLEAMTTEALNVAGYAPGELEAMVARGQAVRVSQAEYAQWLAGLAPALRDKVIADWGPPEAATMMTLDDGTIVVPALRYGNVVLMPQPARGWGEDLTQLYHASDLAPPHQYVAAYRWLREGFDADAVVHLGTHGTLEWLDGKDIGLSGEDAPDALIADLPNIYLYNVDVVGEGLVARRRSAATLIDHMVPPFRKGGLYAELAELSERISDYDQNLHKNEQLVEAVSDQIRALVTELGIAKDLSLDLSAPGSLDDATVHAVQDHLFTLRDQNIPWGLHAFGRTPEPEMRASTVDAIVSVDRSLLPNDAAVLAEDMELRIVASGPQELTRLVAALSGMYIPGGNGGEPIRNPDAYPTGKNFYGIDPEKIPKPASWELGVGLADQMLADHLAQHGRYPEKVSFVIWGDETMRHEGVLESQIFHLLGTRPVWDPRGDVVDVEVVPSAQLGRPRIDIVIASAAEGMFNNVTRLMDEAVQRVKAIDEANNLVRQHYLATKAILIDRGYPEAEADRRAGVRIFDEAPGQFNLNTAGIAAASGSWETDAGMADDYLRKMGHAYGNGFWGEAMEDVFRLALEGTEKIVHSSSTMLYGALDNDDMFMYMGGLAAAIRNIDGTEAELVITNTRDPGRPDMTSIDEFLGTEFRSRYVNPTWIAGMQAEGYAGAGAMREFVEYLWGWDATVSATVDDAMWQETFGVYVEDRHDLGMAQFFEESSPFAYQDMTARMVETIRKGYWNADAATETRLIEELAASVEAHGVSCSDLTCGNPLLAEYVLERGSALGVPAPSLEAFADAVEAATRTEIYASAAEAQAFTAENETTLAERLAETPAPSRDAGRVEGFALEEQQRVVQEQVRSLASSSGGVFEALWGGLPVLAVLLAWRWRRRRAGDSMSRTRSRDGKPGGGTCATGAS